LECAEEYGIERMREDLREFRSLLSELSHLRDTKETKDRDR
jgi:hypothetical protein